MKMRRTAFTFGLVFVLGLVVTFVLQDLIMGLPALIFVVPQILFLGLLLLVLIQLYNS